MTITRNSWAFTNTDTPSATFAGGRPFLEPGELFPTDADGIDLAFLFQADLAQVELDSLELPTEGLLQFFLHPSDLLGMNLDEITACDSMILVRHTLTAVDDGMNEQVKTDSLFGPLTDPHVRIFYEGRLVEMWSDDDSLSPEDDDEGPEFYLGGIPAFVQEDFRESPDEFELLLGSCPGPNIMWGDLGPGGFWLPNDAQIPQNLDKAFLYWDCY